MAEALVSAAAEVRERVTEGFVTKHTGGPTVVTDDVAFAEIFDFDYTHKSLKPLR